MKQTVLRRLALCSGVLVVALLFVRLVVQSPISAEVADDAIRDAHAESERILNEVVIPGIAALAPGSGEAWTEESAEAVIDLIRQRNKALDAERDAINQSGESEEREKRLNKIAAQISENSDTITAFRALNKARAEADRVLGEVSSGIASMAPADGENWTAQNARDAIKLIQKRNSALKDESETIYSNNIAGKQTERLAEIQRLMKANEDLIAQFEAMATESEAPAGDTEPQNTEPQNTEDVTPQQPTETAASSSSSTPDTQSTTNVPQSDQSLAETCGSPLQYHIESVDSGFGLSEGDVRQILAQAEAVWEGPTGRDLFRESPSSSLPIRFVYGTNQETYNILAQMRVEIDADEADFAAGVQLYRDLMEQHRNDPTDEERIDQINAPVDHLKRVGPLLEERVNRFNRIGRASGPMTLGYYYKEGGLEGIKILVLQRSAPKRVRVVAHELAHALGLDHVPDPAALMYEMNSGDDNNLRQDDLNELNKVCARREAGRAVHSARERSEIRNDSSKLELSVR